MELFSLYYTLQVEFNRIHHLKLLNMYIKCFISNILINIKGIKFIIIKANLGLKIDSFHIKIKLLL